MLHKLKELMGLEQRPPRQCEACGQPFVCCASLKGCWCVGVKLSAEVRQQMRAQYKDCLCPACLQQFAAASREAPAHEERKY